MPPRDPEIRSIAPSRLLLCLLCHEDKCALDFIHSYNVYAMGRLLCHTYFLAIVHGGASPAERVLVEDVSGLPPNSHPVRILAGAHALTLARQVARVTV